MSYEKRQDDRQFVPMTKKLREADKPPMNRPWMWMAMDLVRSPAWIAAPMESKLVVLRLIEEHHAHGGLHNGRLAVSFDQFERYGIPRHKLSWAIKCCTALGLIESVKGAAFGNIRRCASYRLTFRPTQDGFQTHEWKRFTNVIDAEQAIPKRRKREKPIIAQPDEEKIVSERGKPSTFAGSTDAA